MYTSISPTQMRQVVLNCFQQHQTQELAGSDLDERARIEDGRVVAYSYRTDSLFAMWMIEIGLVQFYDQEGNMLRTIDLTAHVASDRRAA